MKKYCLAIVMLVSSLLSFSARFFAIAVNQINEVQVSDTVRKVNFTEGGKVVRHKMSHSVSPIRVHVVGKSIRIESSEKQILPIYNQKGMFYLLFRLNKGTNWLNGLPKGGYYINGKLVNVN